jgi:hypothetical protein
MNEFEGLVGKDQYDLRGKGSRNFKSAGTAQMVHLQVE